MQTLSIPETQASWFAEGFQWLTGYPPYRWQVEAFEAFVENRIPSALALSTGSGKTSIIAIWLLALLYPQRSGKTTLPRRLVWVIYDHLDAQSDNSLTGAITRIQPPTSRSLGLPQPDD
jgi:hypothetical protein